MTALRGLGRVTGGVCLFVLAGAICATSALGALTLDLRLPGGGNAVEITSPTQVVNLQLWATVTDTDGSATNDGIWKFYTSILSSNGGVLLGNLNSAAFHSDPVPFPPFQYPTPFNAAPATWGTLQDLDGDGDLDRGSNNPADANDWVLGRASEMQPTLYYPTGYDFMDFSFTGAGWGPDEHGVTKIYLVPRPGGDSLWNENGYTGTGAPPHTWLAGTDISGAPTAGQAITLYIAAEAVAPGGGTLQFNNATGAPDEVFMLDASASAGSMNTFEWDLNGDGTPEFTSNQIITPVTWQEMIDAGLLPGVAYTASLRTSWQESPAVTEDTVTFDFMMVPEPATMALLGLGGLVTLLRRRR